MATKKTLSLYKEIYTHLPIAVCILSPKNNTIEEVNSAFESLTGYTQSQLQSKPKVLCDLIYKSDFKKIAQRLECLDDSQHIGEELRILTQENSWKHVEIALKKVKNRVLCILRDIEAKRDFEQHLREKIEEEREKAEKILRGTIRIRQLLEKLHRGPAFFRELWKCKDTETLLHKAANLMTRQVGLLYANVTILLKDGDYLCVKASSKEQALQRFHLEKQHKFAQVFRGEKRILSDDSGECTLPIASPNGTEGVLQVFFEEKERVLLAENDYTKQAHWDLLECIAEFLGLLLYTFHSIPHGDSIFRHNLTSMQQTLDKKIAEEDFFTVLLTSVDDFSQTTFLHPDIMEKLENSIMQALDSFKPTGSLLFHIREDQFILIIPGNVHKSAPHEAEQIQRKLQQTTFEIASHKYRFTFSIGGCSHFSEKSVKSGELLQQVLRCLKKAQQKGGNSIFVWKDRPQEIRKRVTTRLQ